MAEIKVTFHLHETEARFDKVLELIRNGTINVVTVKFYRDPSIRYEVECEIDERIVINALGLASK